MEYCIAQLRLLCSRQRCRLSIIRFTRLTRITRGSRSRRRRSNLGVSSRGSGSKAYWPRYQIAFGDDHD